MNLRARTREERREAARRLKEAMAKLREAWRLAQQHTRG